MTIYFIPSKNIDKETVRKIEALLKTRGNTITETTTNFTIEERANPEVIKTVKMNIQRADVVVLEATGLAPDIAYYMAFCFDAKVKVIALDSSDKPDKSLVYAAGKDGDLVQITSYKTDKVEKMRTELYAKLENIKKGMSTSMTLAITPQIAKYLDFVTQGKKLSRATYLRSLVEDRLQKDKKYMQTFK